MVETVGLENRCTGNRTGGSNPSPSAKQSGLQRIPALVSRKIRELCLYFAILARQTGLRRTDCCCGKRHQEPLFLCNGDEQSEFEELVGRMLGDQKSNWLRTRLDFSPA